MNSKILFTFNAIICFLFAIPLLIIPAQFLSQYMISGDQLGGVGSAISKAYGGMILGLGIALWLGRHSSISSLTRKILLWFILIAGLIAVYAYLTAVLSGATNKMIYTSIILEGILSIWAAVLLFKKSSES